MTEVKVSNIRDMFEKPKPTLATKPEVKAKPPKPLTKPVPPPKTPAKQADTNGVPPDLPKRDNSGTPKRLLSVKSPLLPGAQPVLLNDLLKRKDKLNSVEKTRDSMVGLLTANFEKIDENAKPVVKTKPAPPARSTGQPALLPKHKPAENKQNQEANNHDPVTLNNTKNLLTNSMHSKADTTAELIEHNGAKYRKCVLPPNLGQAPLKPSKPSEVVLHRPRAGSDMRRLPSLPPESGRKVSLIEPMGEEEEEEFYDDTISPQTVPERRVNKLPPEPPQFNEEPIEEETYDDVSGTVAIDEENIIEEDIYEEFDGPDNRDAVQENTEEFYDDTDPPMIEQDSSEIQNNEKEKKIQEEKERKEREKAEKEDRKRKEKEEKERIKRLKEEEKEQKRKKEEEKKMLAKFKITGNEEPINTVVVQEDCKGGKYELMVKQGDQLMIIRTEGNPAGKWLAKNQDGKYGYVTASMIKVETSALEQLASCSNLKLQPHNNAFDQSTADANEDYDMEYEDVDPQNGNNGSGITEEDIYEEF